MWRSLCLERNNTQDTQSMILLAKSVCIGWFKSNKLHSLSVYVGKQRLVAVPLILVSVEAPFLQWGLNFINEIVPSSIINRDGYSQQLITSQGG